MPQTLPGAVCVRRAKDMSFSASMFSDTEAQGRGLVNEVYEGQAELDSAMTKISARKAANSGETIAAMRDMCSVTAEQLVSIQEPKTSMIGRLC